MRFFFFLAARRRPLVALSLLPGERVPHGERAEQIDEPQPHDRGLGVPPHRREAQKRGENKRAPDDGGGVKPARAPSVAVAVRRADVVRAERDAERPEDADPAVRDGLDVED